MSEPTEQKTEPEVSPDNPEQKPEPSEKPPEHPQFQKRINEFTYKVNSLETKLEAEHQARLKDDAAFNALAEQNKQLAESLDKVEDKVFDVAAPDPETDPTAYADWRDERLLKKMEKMVKPPTELPPPPPSPAVPPQPRSQDMRETVQQGLHDDYKEMVAETMQDMKTDRALYNTVWQAQNPYKEAYDYGKRKINMSNQARQGNLNQAYAEGGGVPPGADGANRLTESEKYLADKLNITEEKYLNRKQIIAQRRSGK